MPSSFFVNNGGSTAARTTISDDLTASAAAKSDAQKLAINAEDAQFTLSDGVTTGNSALHYSAKASASATAAEGSATTATQQAGIATQAKLDAQTAKAEAVALHTDAVNLTGDQTIAGAKTFSGAFATQGIDDNATSTAVTIDNSGNFLVGATAPTPGNGNTDTGHLFKGDGRLFSSSASNSQFNRNSEGDILTFRQSGTLVGSISTNAGWLELVGASGVPVRISGQSSFYKFAASAFFPQDDNARDLGISSARWDDVYATNGSIQTSDANDKQDIEALSEAEQRVAVACKGLLRKFRWKSAVEEKGDDARIHFGIIAQDLKSAFEAEGLDAGRYAMFISSTWTDEETGEEKTRLGVRYSELLAFIISAL